MTIEQVDTIVHTFILRQFLHNSASRRIIQNGRSRKFHYGELCHLDFWKQFVDTVDNARPTLIISAFYRLTPRPIRLSPVMHRCTSLMTDLGEHPIAASSRYQTFSSESTPLAIRSTVRAYRRGPIGSPCCTPVDEVI